MLLTQIPGYFKERRDRLAQSQPSAMFVFPSAHEVLRNPDVHFPFRQESNFYYLCGFDEPDSCLVLTPSGSKPGTHRTVLFVRRRDPEREMWEGERHGPEGALRVFGVDESYPIEELDQRLPELIRGSERVYYRMGHDEGMDRRMVTALEQVRRSQGRSGKSLLPVADPNEILGEMRLFKSAEEVELLRKACQVTALAHKTAMKEARPGMNEAEIEALIEYVFRRNGCQRVGYGSIVAGGRNATCLHYRSNCESLRDGSLLLIDAGGELGYYTSDITRTFPVGKRFSDAQKKVYALVLVAQKEAIRMVAPGATIPSIHQHVCEVMVEGLLSLDLLQGKKEEIIKTGAYRRFYPHQTSHWLGMDVHDLGRYVTDRGEPRKLEAGMCLTIEPGFYVQPSDLDAPAQFRDIGIRIEDDLLVTITGNEVLTRDAPKEIEEIEALRS